MTVQADVSAWPIAVLVRRPAVDGTAPVDDAGPVFGSLLDRRERFGLVMDLGRQTESQQAQLAAFLRQNRVRAQRYVVGCALVVPQAAVERSRELISAQPQLYPFPAWVAATRDECWAWVEGVLASSGPTGGRLHR